MNLLAVEVGVVLVGTAPLVVLIFCDCSVESRYVECQCRFKLGEPGTQSHRQLHGTALNVQTLLKKRAACLPCQSGPPLATRGRKRHVSEWEIRNGCTYAAFELTDEHRTEKRTGILGVSDILESLSGVLSASVTRTSSPPGCCGCRNERQVGPEIDGLSPYQECGEIVERSDDKGSTSDIE